MTGGRSLRGRIGWVMAAVVALLIALGMSSRMARANDAGSYPVTVTCVNVADPEGTPLLSYEHVVSATDERTQHIPIPMSVGEGAYVLIPGQLFEAADQDGCMALLHSYDAPGRSYLIYYRAINDTAYVNTIISPTGATTSLGEPFPGIQDIGDDATPLVAPWSFDTAARVKQTVFGGLLAAVMMAGVGLFAYFVRKKREEDLLGGLDADL